ncbi:MAG: DoxX family protein [Veillonellaceae bacterium]|nr:DoxX family protein [Veillonellaceae bacterium]
MKYFMQLLMHFLSSYRDFGLLVFRLVLGGMFMWHGWPKIIGGPEKWSGLGSAMATFGIEFAPAAWGFMSGFAEFVGGALFALGLFYRLASLLLFVNMMVAFVSQMAAGKGLAKASQSLEAGVSFFAALFVGPGKYSIDYYLEFEKDPKRSSRFLR